MDYEVVIPYFMRFRLESNEILSRIELLEKCHQEGDGKLIGCDDEQAEITLGVVKE